MNIYIADCNHGFFDPEIEESARLGAKLVILDCDQESLIEQAKEADVLIVQRFQVNSKILDSLERCKVVTRYGVGLDNVDCDAAKERGVSVVNFPSFCTEEVANHALASILYCYRQFYVHISEPHRLPGYWGNPKPVVGIQSAPQTTVGVLGAGRIGKAVISRLLACGFRAIFCDPYLDKDDIDFLCEMGAERIEDMDHFLRMCSILSIHTPLTPETEGMINARTLGLLPSGSVLINTARGPIVVTADLESALCNNLRCAFIDVCDPEPPKQAILENAAIFVTPHCAYYSQQSLERLKRGVIVDSVKAYEMQCSTSQRS